MKTSLEKVQKQNYVSAMLGSGMFGGVESSIAAASRWHTASMGMSLQMGGTYFHSLLQRAWRLAFGEWTVPAGLSDDFAKLIRSKAYRGKLWLSNEFIGIKQGVYVFCASAAEHLTQQLQSMDSQTVRPRTPDASDGVLRVVTSVSNANPIIACLAAYSLMLLRCITPDKIEHTHKLGYTDHKMDHVVVETSAVWAKIMESRA